MKIKVKLEIGISIIAIVMIFLIIRLKNSQFVIPWFDNTPLKVQVANTPSTLERGLMYRKKLPENQGMLFVFDKPASHCFWMKNTYIPLSIAFISIDKKIIQIDSMFPLDTLNIRISRKPSKYAIEVNQGWFKRHKIKTEDKIRGISF